MYIFGTTIDNNYLQLNSLSGGGYDNISNFTGVNFNSIPILSEFDDIYINSLVFPSYESSSTPKYEIEDNIVTYSGRPSFSFTSRLSGTIYSILTGNDFTKLNNYTFTKVDDNFSYHDYGDLLYTKLDYTSGGKPIIKKAYSNSISFCELTGKDIHDSNQWIKSGNVVDSYGAQCDFTLSNNNDKVSFTYIDSTQSLYYSQLTGDNIMGPYITFNILSAGIGNEDGATTTSIKFNSAGNVAFATTNIFVEDDSNYNGIIYTELTGTNLEILDNYSFTRFNNISGASNAKLDFNTINGKPSIVYKDENSSLVYLSLTGNQINDISNWSSVNLNVTAFDCSFDYQPENSFYPGSPVISYYNSFFTNIIQLTSSNYFTITGADQWGDHTAGFGGITHLNILSGFDPIFFDSLPLKDPRTYPIADKVGMSFFDDTSDALKYAELTGKDFSSANSFGVYTVDEANVTGKFSSLKFLSGSIPAISYHDNVIGDLKYAQLTGSDFDGTPSQSDWGILTLDSTNDTGEFTSLELINNRPAIAYVNQTNDDLKYIELTGTNFYDSTNWGSLILEDTGLSEAGVSLAISKDSKPAIAYRRSGTLKFTQLTGSDVTGLDNWGRITIPVPAPGPGEVGKFSSLQFLSTNEPAIAHIDTDNDYFYYTQLTGSDSFKLSSWGNIRLHEVDSNEEISLQVNPNNNKPAISFINNSGKLSYTQLTGSDTFKLSSWALETISSDASKGTSLQFSSAGAPGIMTRSNAGQTVRYFQLTGVDFSDFSSIEQLSLSSGNWGESFVASGIAGGDSTQNSLAFSEFQFTNEFKLSADRLSAFEGETFNIKLSTNNLGPNPPALLLDFNIDPNNGINETSYNEFTLPTIDTLSFDVSVVDKVQTLTFDLPQLYKASEGVNPDHQLDIILGKSLTVPVTSLSPAAAEELIFDESCNRIILKELINPAKDIVMSFQTNRDAVNLLTDPGSGVEITTDLGINIIGEFNIIQGSGFSVFLVQGEEVLDEVGGEPGPGLGLLATNNTSLSAMSGHIISIAYDFAGFYGIRNLFKNSGDRGYLNQRPFTISSRLSTINSQYDFLSANTFNEDIFKYINPIKIYRVRFKEHLNRIFFDIKDDFSEKYITLASFETNIDLASVPRGVKLGLSYSGQQNLPVKDITYSANVY